MTVTIKVAKNGYNADQTFKKSRNICALVYADFNATHQEDLKLG